MLTKQDLGQIKKIVDGSVKSIKTDVSGLKGDISGLKKDVGGLKTDVSGLKKDMSQVKKDVKKIDKKFDELFDFIDKDHMNLVKRVVRIETHLNIQPQSKLIEK